MTFLSLLILSVDFILESSLFFLPSVIVPAAFLLLPSSPSLPLHLPLSLTRLLTIIFFFSPLVSILQSWSINVPALQGHPL